MKIKTIANNCISDIINSRVFDKIFVYGAENLELEKLIYNLTSSPIIGGDVDFCNVLLGKYFSGLAKENIDKLKEFAFNNEDIDYIPLSAILGRSDINKNDAMIIDKALNKLISKGEIKKITRKRD